MLLLACILNVCGLLVAGLWPFTPYLHNDVSWLGHENGLFFGEFSTMLSTAPLHLEGSPDGPCSVELWQQPALIDDSNTMLAFQTRETPLQFRIQQINDALRLTRQEVGPDGQPRIRRITLHHVLKKNLPVLITVTAGPHGTAVYLNGVLARSSPDFGLTPRDLNGGIVVGNSPVINDSWSGILRGIGIYNRELTADEVRRNFEDWTHSGRPSGLEEKQAVAIYNFTEHAGRITHNQLSSGVDLAIPKYYVVLYPPFLNPFWNHWGWNWGFWQDGIINVTGFMPFGFLFCAYFSRSRPVGRAVLLTIILGCAISFLIEGTQYFLPTRDSDSMDFINNTLGSALGAVLYLPKSVQAFMARFGIVPLESNHIDSLAA
jgi:glycopeptide antibiotics resistance protein